MAKSTSDCVRGSIFPFVHPLIANQFEEDPSMGKASSNLSTGWQEKIKRAFHVRKARFGNDQASPFVKAEVEIPSSSVAMDYLGAWYHVSGGKETSAPAAQLFLAFPGSQVDISLVAAGIALTHTNYRQAIQVRR